MDDRKKVILDRVIENYITTAEPVGSKIIQQTCDLEISTATIRNELNELEKEGFLTHLHTSSGRVPTDKGYRLFVDSVMNVKSFPLEQQKIFENKIKLLETNVNGVLNQITEIMTEIIDYTAIVITPDIYNETLKIVHFILVDIDRILVVLLNSLGINREFLINLVDNKLGQDDFNEISKFLTEKLDGKNFADFNQEVFIKLIEELPKFRNTTEVLFKEIKKVMKVLQKEKSVLMRGTSKMLKLPEFKNIEYTRKVLEILEENKLLVNVLSLALDEKQDKVLIGQENAISDLDKCSLAISPIKVDDEAIGVVSVLGPTRMAYPFILPMLNFICQRVTNFVTEKRR